MGGCLHASEGHKHALETLYSRTLSKFVLKCELQRVKIFVLLMRVSLFCLLDFVYHFLEQLVCALRLMKAWIRKF